MSHSFEAQRKNTYPPEVWKDLAWWLAFCHKLVTWVGSLTWRDVLTALIAVEGPTSSMGSTLWQLLTQIRRAWKEEDYPGVDSPLCPANDSFSDIRIGFSRLPTSTKDHGSSRTFQGFGHQIGTAKASCTWWEEGALSCYLAGASPVRGRLIQPPSQSVSRLLSLSRVRQLLVLF